MVVFHRWRTGGWRVWRRWLASRRVSRFIEYDARLHFFLLVLYVGVGSNPTSDTILYSRSSFIFKVASWFCIFNCFRFFLLRDKSWRFWFRNKVHSRFKPSDFCRLLALVGKALRHKNPRRFMLFTFFLCQEASLVRAIAILGLRLLFWSENRGSYGCSPAFGESGTIRPFTRSFRLSNYCKKCRNIYQRK